MPRPAPGTPDGCRRPTSPCVVPSRIRRSHWPRSTPGSSPQGTSTCWRSRTVRTSTPDRQTLTCPRHRGRRRSRAGRRRRRVRGRRPIPSRLDGRSGRCDRHHVARVPRSHSVLLGDVLAGGRHDRRLGHGGRPVGMSLTHQREEPGNMRARHRSPRDRWNSCPGVPALGNGVWPARMFTPHAVTSGLIASAATGLSPLDESRPSPNLVRVRPRRPSALPWRRHPPMRCTP